ncbi:MAG: DUF5335 family protein [Chloroflexota bacterium]|nr:DUF5335 family protein [Chloroflexota bacterium]
MDHDPTHQPRMIPASQWTAFFEELNQNFGGKSVHVEQGTGSMTPVAQTGSITLVGLDYEHHRRHPHLTIELAGAGTPEIPIDPNLVWGVYDRDEQLFAVEIIDQHDYKVNLQFGQV